MSGEKRNLARTKSCRSLQHNPLMIVPNIHDRRIKRKKKEQRRGVITSVHETYAGFEIFRDKRRTSTSTRGILLRRATPSSFLNHNL